LTLALHGLELEEAPIAVLHLGLHPVPQANGLCLGMVVGCCVHFQQTFKKSRKVRRINLASINLTMLKYAYTHTRIFSFSISTAFSDSTPINPSMWPVNSLTSAWVVRGKLMVS
jgi:hypothetical protein